MGGGGDLRFDAMGLFKKKDETPPPALTQEQQILASVGLTEAAVGSSLTAHSGFIKRVSCSRCGAPKTLPSKTAYLYCDYCGALVDYDFRLANAGTNAAITNTVYHRLLQPVQALMHQARMTGDRDQYRQLQLHVFRQWIAECPQAVSPRAKTDLEFRERMVAYCAECAVTKDMDPYQQQLEAQVNGLIAAFQRVPTPGGAWMVHGDFWTMASLWKQQMDLAYEAMAATGVSAMDPDDPPEGVALRMEYSTFCQSWLPHLPPEHGQHLLAMYGLTADYMEVPAQPTEQHRCGGCGSSLITVTGARVVVCEDCGRRVDVAAGAVPCRQCGAALDLVEGVSTLSCPYCQAQTARV